MRWKTIKEAPNYKISDTGLVLSKKRKANMGLENKFRIVKERIRKQSLNSNGYMCLSVTKGSNKRYTLHIHRLVAKAFCKQPKGKDYVNHKDGNRLNNIYSNLEWVTSSENAIHAFQKLGRKPNTPWKGKKGKDFPSSKPISYYHLVTKEKGKFASYSEAEKELKISYDSISSVCKGIIKSHKGYVFKEIPKKIK